MAPGLCSLRLLAASGMVPSHGLGLESDQTLSGRSHKRCAVIAQHLLQADHHWRLRGAVAGLVFTFLFWHARRLPVPRTLGSRCRDSRKAPALLCSVRCVWRAIFSSRTSPSIYGGQPITWVVWGVSIEPLWPATRLGETHSLSWRFW